MGNSSIGNIHGWLPSGTYLRLGARDQTLGHLGIFFSFLLQRQTEISVHYSPSDFFCKKVWILWLVLPTTQSFIQPNNPKIENELVQLIIMRKPFRLKRVKQYHWISGFSFTTFTWDLKYFCKKSMSLPL